MFWMKRTALAIAAGAALSLYASAPASAAPIGQAAGMAGAVVAQTAGNLIEVRRRGHRRYGHWRGRRYYGGYGYRRYGGWRGRRYGYYRRHRHRGFPWWYVAPLIAAPFIYHHYRYDPYY